MKKLFNYCISATIEVLKDVGMSKFHDMGENSNVTKIMKGSPLLVQEKGGRTIRS